MFPRAEQFWVVPEIVTTKSEENLPTWLELLLLQLAKPSFLCVLMTFPFLLLQGSLFPWQLGGQRVVIWKIREEKGQGEEGNYALKSSFNFQIRTSGLCEEPSVHFIGLFFLGFHKKWKFITSSAVLKNTTFLLAFICPSSSKNCLLISLTHLLIRLIDFLTFKILYIFIYYQ